jgi:cation-transporting ATPase 13A2
MQLTETPTSFKFFLVGIAAAGFVASYFLEHYVLPQLARAIGKVKLTLSPKSKKRKLYKLLEQEMRI